MHFSPKEREILRGLAFQYRELSELPVNSERAQRMYQTNGLTHTRPPVLLAEIPWHELNGSGELTLHCENDFARSMEQFFRRSLFQWNHFPGDMVLDRYFCIQKAYHCTGEGIEVREETRITDANNHIISHQYEDLLADEESIEKLQLPVVTAFPELDAERMAVAEDVLNGILPVRLTGHYIYCAPWDRIARLRGVQSIYLDLALRPEFTHKIIRRFTEMNAAKVDQMDALGLFSCDIGSLHCTPSYSGELEAIERKNGHPSRASCWFRGMAQAFAGVSPEMHEEFDIEYMRPLAERFGLTYYGCCEPLDDRLEQVMKIRNLRKVGATPWANINIMAEQLGSMYVLSRKPNPALVAGSIDEDAIRKEVRETAEACIRNGCPWDYTLKDISTVNYRIQNLTRWNEIVQKTLDEYY